MIELDPRAPRTSPVTVETPDGAPVPLDDPMLQADLEAAAGAPVALMQVARGIYDAMPISIQTSAGHARLETVHGSALDPRRFRINVTIESELDPQEFQGLRLAFGADEGGAVVHCADPIPRCMLITIDPDTAAKDVGILRTVAQQFGKPAGDFGRVVRIDEIASLSVRHHVRHPASVRGHDGNPHCHCFLYRQRRVLFERHQRHDARVREQMTDAIDGDL